MRVLHVNKFAFARGGAEEYMFRLSDRQAEAGDEVAIFGSAGDVNTTTTSRRLFDFRVQDFHAATSTTSRLRAAREVLWSTRAATSLSQAIEDFRPDVVHVHNYAHQLSSSIIDLMREQGMPVVATAHDYKLICPAYVANRKGQDCFACSHHVSAKLILDRCHHDDLSWSALAAAEAVVVRSKRLTPDHIIAPSQYMADALASSWVATIPISMIRNPAESVGLRWRGGGSLLYVGRLSREKGVEPLIQAAIEARIPLTVAGDGPLRGDLERSSDPTIVTFVGHLPADELARLRERCLAQIVPSEWPENAPLSALEAAIDGVPLIASPRGGLPEFANIGARVSFMNEITGASLQAAVRELDSRSGNMDLLRETLSWSRHLRLVTEVYGRVTA